MAIDRKTIQNQLVEFRNRLARLEDERGALQGIIKGYEVLLKAGDPGYTSPSANSLGGGSPATITITGSVGGPATVSVSMRSTVARVLREANGPIRSKDILDRARELGADTNAKNPVSVIDLYIRRLIADGKVKKVAPRTWRWVGG
jgi:hypothetical protein